MGSGRSPAALKKLGRANVSRRNAENRLKIVLTAKTVRNKEKPRPKSAFTARESARAALMGENTAKNEVNLMGIGSYSVHVFVCTCDVCGCREEVKENINGVYNGAQAVRSLGWSFGKDKVVKCDKCRKTAWGDMYREKHKLYR